MFTASVVPWDGLPPLSPELKGYTYSGYSSILTMPLGLLAGGALFSEAMWQRVWAIEERRAMTRAAWTAGLAVAAVIFFFGVVGFLAFWSGKATAETNTSLYFFAIFGLQDFMKPETMTALKIWVSMIGLGNLAIIMVMIKLHSHC